jgi:5-methyltetrahydropteroyltriglutamate--homocysteine methyltransferase
LTGLGLFPVTGVGSWPRPPELLQAQRQRRLGLLRADEFNLVADSAVLDVLRLQEAAGVDVVTDGEQRRDNFVSFVAATLDGVKLMTLSEMLEVVEDRSGLERTLQALDVPAYSISNAVCVGPISRSQAMAVDELLFLKRHTARPIKVPLPGPYMLTRSMFVAPLTQVAYATKEALAEDVVGVLRSEIGDLIEAGAAFIQLDEPVLAELVFGQGATRTFMCAAISTRSDPAEELEFAVGLINRVVEGFAGTRIGLHICRGNWSRNEETLLRGDYFPLAADLARLNVTQLVLEHATQRAGDILHFPGKELGLGVVNPRTDLVESPQTIVAAVARALRLYSADRVWLNPDCGFGTFSNRPVNESAIAFEKMRAISAAAELCRSVAGRIARP